LSLVRFDYFNAHGKIIKVPGDHCLVKKRICIYKQAKIPGPCPNHPEILLFFGQEYIGQ